MAGGWKRPMHTPILLGVLVLVLAVLTVEALVAGMPSAVMLGLAVGMLVALFANALVAHNRMRDIWSSERRVFLALGRGPSPMPAIEEALRREGLSAVRREQPRFKDWATLDIGRALNVTVVTTFAGYVAYVGPVRDDMRREIDRIERAVEAAMEPFERERERQSISQDTVEEGG